MASRYAIEVFARLCAHWPSLGGDDLAATIRAEDWCIIIERADEAMARTICAEMVQGWGDQWPPKVADWLEAQRRLIHRRNLEATAAQLLAPPDEAMVPRERVDALLTEARASLVEPRREWTPLRGTGAVDPLEPALPYEDAYQENGEPRPEYRAEIEAMKRRP